MSTLYSTVHKFIRGLLGDTDDEVLMYSDEVLDTQIEFFGMNSGSSRFAKNGEASSFLQDLTPPEKAMVVFSVVEQIIVPQSDSFSYKHAVLSVSRSGGVLQLLSYVRNKIDILNGGAFAISSMTDLEAFVSSPYWEERDIVVAANTAAAVVIP